jgi:hypothetical protein
MTSDELIYRHRLRLFARAGEVGVEAPAAAVPAEDGLRSDEDEMSPPGREEPFERPARRIDPWS